MKKLIVLAVLLCSGCTPGYVWISSHEPTLGTPPSDQEKYKSDLELCREYARHPNNSGGAISSLTGPLGSVLYSGATGDNSPWKMGPEYVDDCMKSKGYDVK
jgi:hypothetical protein